MSHPIPPTSIFDRTRTYTQYELGIHCYDIVGGTPSDPRIIEGWIRTNLGDTPDQEIARLVAETMLEREIEAPDAIQAVAATMKLNGFKRDPEHGLYSEGRHLKACIKEAANVSWPKRRWGPSSKGTLSWWPEHVFVAESRLYHGRTEPDEPTRQRFVSTWRGTSMVYEEVNYDVDLSATILIDNPKLVSDEDWEGLWTRAEQIGLGAVRSQGYGKFVVTKWGRVR